jgi:hypothetical protein
MADLHQPSNEDPEFLEFEGYSRSLSWNHGALSSVQGAFDSIGPPGSTQASELVNDHVSWQAHPQITTHSAPQLYSPRATINPHMRPYHSGPMAHSRQFAAFDAPGMFSGNESRSMLPMNLNLSQQAPGVSTLLV